MEAGTETLAGVSGSMVQLLGARLATCILSFWDPSLHMTWGRGGGKL